MDWILDMPITQSDSLKLSFLRFLNAYYHDSYFGLNLCRTGLGLGTLYLDFKKSMIDEYKKGTFDMNNKYSILPFIRDHP